MPWKESSVMEERLRFVARLLEGERMSAVCRSFGISRKTGYKTYNLLPMSPERTILTADFVGRRAFGRRSLGHTGTAGASARDDPAVPS